MYHNNSTSNDAGKFHFDFLIFSRGILGPTTAWVGRPHVHNRFTSPGLDYSMLNENVLIL